MALNTGPTQVQLEKEMVALGKDKIDRIHQEAEDKGRASSNPYASAIHRRFVLPLAAALDKKYTGDFKTRGPRSQVRRLMQGLDSTVVAYLSVRIAMNKLVPEHSTKAPALAASLGRALYGETILRAFEDINPALFFAMTRDMKRKMTQDERHKINVFRGKARSEGFELPEWSITDRALVGHAVLRELALLGMLDHTMTTERGKSIGWYALKDEIRDLLDHIKEYVSFTQPTVMPCIERPKPWVAPDDGGWHTTAMRRTAPTCITSEAFIPEGDVPQVVLDNLTYLQDVEWQINNPLLEAVHQVSRHFDVGEVLAQEDIPKPMTPTWLTPDMKAEDMDELQYSEFVSWKRRVACWHTDMKLRRTKWGRFYEALRTANRFKDYEKIHFVYQMDYRFRKYARTRGVNPQGGDLQKALLRFREGCRINESPETVFWFKVNGANRYGFDKAALDDRAAWVDEHHANIIEIARDPISTRDWTEADNPFQFLAWCFEYADWQAFPDQARTHLPVGLDGSCNGLQHLSAMTHDEIGGKATNLMPGERQDIYRIVADKLQGKLDPSEPWHDVWIKHGMNRDLTKRPCMTLAYSATRYSCAEFIMQDYLRKGYVPEVPFDGYLKAANALSHPMWDTIKEVVVRGMGAMEWMQNTVKTAIEAGHDEITWKTPLGGTVRQTYQARHTVRLVSRLHGGFQLTIRMKESDPTKVDGRRHVQGIVPNLVHSLDATHLDMTLEEAKKHGIRSLSAIHDDYGTLPNKTGDLYRIIREQFVRLYSEHDPLKGLADQYGIEELPEYGNLDIHGVLDSESFFS